MQERIRQIAEPPLNQARSLLANVAHGSPGAAGVVHKVGGLVFGFDSLGFSVAVIYCDFLLYLVRDFFSSENTIYRKLSNSNNCPPPSNNLPSLGSFEKIIAHRSGRLFNDLR